MDKQTIINRVRDDGSVDVTGGTVVGSIKLAGGGRSYHVILLYGGATMEVVDLRFPTYGRRVGQCGYPLVNVSAINPSEVAFQPSPTFAVLTELVARCTQYYIAHRDTQPDGYVRQTVDEWVRLGLLSQSAEVRDALAAVFRRATNAEAEDELAKGARSKLTFGTYATAVVVALVQKAESAIP